MMINLKDLYEEFDDTFGDLYDDYIDDFSLGFPIEDEDYFYSEETYFEGDNL